MGNISIDKTKWTQKIKRWINENKSDLRGLSIFSQDENCFLLYQSKSNLKSNFSLAKSNNGLYFELLSQNSLIENRHGYFENIETISDLDIIKKLKDYNLFYTKKKRSSQHVFCLAKSKDLINWNNAKEILNIGQSGIVIKNYKHHDNHILYSGINRIKIYQSNNLYDWQEIASNVLTTRPGHFDSNFIKVVYGFLYNNQILVFYLAYDHSLQKNPSQLIWRTDKPIWTQSEEWKYQDTTLIGVTMIDKKIISYWNVGGVGIYGVIHPFSLIKAYFKKDHVFLKLNKPVENPLISPNSKNSWEAFCTFNAAAVYEAGKVHLVYRAQGYDYISVLGYASSNDGFTIDERLDYPLFQSSIGNTMNGKSTKSVNYDYVSGGGWGGCEDPRITKIDDRFYMTYVAFDGFSPPRIALTSITVDDFLSKRWLWEKPVLISAPGVVNKNCVIFPEKINGKYVIIHRIYPNVLLDYVDDLNFDGSRFLEGQYQITPRKDKWDSKKIGAGSPPIKTDKGWLFIYQAVGYQDGGKYKIGAMLLDLNRPERVIARSNSPILEPDSWYENHGFKPGVTYPCGAVVIENTLYVYYGAADSYVCVATADIGKFISDLSVSGNAKLDNPTIHPVRMSNEQSF